MGTGRASIAVGGSVTPLEAERLGAAGYNWTWFSGQAQRDQLQGAADVMQAVELGRHLSAYAGELERLSTARNRHAYVPDTPSWHSSPNVRR
jgi:hypothetical protein